MADAAGLQLFDLYPDILFKLLREYLSFDDKLRTLWDMPEFRPYLEDREAWITSSYLSVPFLDWIRTLKLGWYIHKDNWSHRFQLQLDPHHLTVSLRHFILDYGLNFCESPQQVVTGQKSLECIQQLFRVFLKDYEYISDMSLCTYHLKPYGLLMVQYDWQSGDRSKLRFYDWEECNLSFYSPVIMKDITGENHFKLMLTCNRTLTVECVLTTGLCLCEQRVLNLLPITWEMEPSGLRGIDGAIIPEAACQTLRMVNEGLMVHSEMKFYVPYYCNILIESADELNRTYYDGKLIPLDLWTETDV